MTNQTKSQKPLIDINKKYKTRSGLDVRVICTDLVNKDYPIECIIDNYVKHFTKYGAYYEGIDTQYDLIEHSPWMDLKVDHPIIVGGHKRHFCKYEDGLVHVYCYGATSWSSCGETDTVAVQADRCTIATL